MKKQERIYKENNENSYHFDLGISYLFCVVLFLFQYSFIYYPDNFYWAFCMCMYVRKCMDVCFTMLIVVLIVCDSLHVLLGECLCEYMCPC